MKVTKLRMLFTLETLKKNITYAFLDEAVRKAYEDEYECLYEEMIDSLESYCNVNLTEITNDFTEEEMNNELTLAAKFLRMYADRLEESYNN